MKKMIKKIQEKVTDIEDRHRRLNIQKTGIPEKRAKQGNRTSPSSRELP